MDDNNVRKVLAYRWLIFCLLALAYFFVYFHRFALSIVAVDIDKAFKPSASLMGILGSVYFYCYAFMQFPAGLISDSLGPRKGVTFFLIIASLGSVLFGIASFDFIVSADEIKARKPDPEPFLLAARQLGVKPAECLVIEDSHSGCLAARRAGMGLIWVRPHSSMAAPECDLAVDDLKDPRIRKMLD